MLLQRLSEYADRLDLPPTLYSEGPLRYIIQLDGTGRLRSPDPIDTADPSSPRTKRGQRRQLPQVVRASGVKPLLLADKADYALGYVGEGGKAGRVSSCHAAFVDLVSRCADSTGEPAVCAILHFLQEDPLAQLAFPGDFDPSAIITFSVDGTLPIDLPAVQRFWALENDPAGKDSPVMQCVVCGEEKPVLLRLQGKLKGIPGGQSSGTSLISANAEAFESYGLAASLVAPTCASCGERFTKSANDLLTGEKNRIVIGDSVYIFWTREETGFPFADLLTEPDPEEVQRLLTSALRGIAPGEVDDTRFFAASLSASGGRAVVRDWLDTTVREAITHLAAWFRRQELVDAWGSPGRPLGLYALAASTVRDAKDLPPTTLRSLVRGALTGAPLPRGLLFQAVRRNRAEQTVTRPRAALIKLVLSSLEPKESLMPFLDDQSPSPAYHCGRLLAVLEEAQRLAIPGAASGIVDRFFGTASSAPASVFGRLLRGAQPHLAKLERDRPGAYHALQRRMEEILAHLTAFPKTLSLQDQGLFALGYYHQRALDRAAARDAAEARRDDRVNSAAPIQ